MDGTAMRTTEETIHLPLGEIDDSPFQKPRVSMRGNLEELAASMRLVGVLEPAIVRRVGKRYEIVAGHRRKRGAKLAGLEVLPCLVRSYTDDQVLEIQMIENGQREDVHPLDEADNFEALIKRGWDVTKIADKIGRLPTYVQQRLALCHLVPACRAALDDNTITLALALLIARIPNEQLQVEALQEVAGDDEREACTAKKGGEIIRERFMLRLVDAPFDRASTELVAAAGACTVCPKRSGNQHELFADVASPDVCIDPTCYRSKLDAHFKVLQVVAKKTDAKVLSQKDSQKVFDKFGDRLTYNSGFHSLDDKVYDGTRSVEVRKLVKDTKVEVTLAQNPHTGAIHELVNKKSVLGIISAREQERSKGSRKAASGSTKKVSPAEKARREREASKADVAKLAGEHLLVAIAAKLEAMPASHAVPASRKATALVLDLVLAHLPEMQLNGCGEVLRRREIPFKNTSTHEETLALLKWSEKASESEKRSMIVEIMLGDAIHDGYLAPHQERRLEAFCKELSIDRKAIAKHAAEVIKEKREKASTEKPAAKASKKKAKRS